MNLLALHAQRSNRLPWERLWGRCGKPLDIDAEGFVAAPRRGERLLSANAHLYTLAELESVRCLLAVGDPALGKSWDLEAYAYRLAARLSAASPSHSDLLIALAAAGFSTREEFRNAVLRHTAYSAWLAGSGVLYLVIDGVDENRFPDIVFTQCLLELLEELPLDRLRARFSCRTASAPPELSAGLRRLFRSDRSAAMVGPSTPPPSMAALPAANTPLSSATPPADIGSLDFQEIEIAPLTRTQVVEAATARLGSAGDIAGFLQAIANAGAEHLHPVPSHSWD